MSLVKISGTGNADGRTHGVWRFLRTGRLPKGCGAIRGQVTALRQAVETEALLRHERLGTYQQALISTVVDAEICRLLYKRWLTNEGEKLPLDKQAVLLREMLRSGETRNNALKDLKLDRAPEPIDVWASVYESPAAAPTTADSQTAKPEEAKNQ